MISCTGSRVHIVAPHSGDIPRGLGRLMKLKRLVLAGNEHITGGTLEIDNPVQSCSFV